MSVVPELFSECASSATAACLVNTSLQYQYTQVIAVTFGLFAFFCTIHIFARFDKSLSNQLIDWIRPAEAYSTEEAQKHRLSFLWRHRQTLLQVSGWFTYSYFAAFIIVDGFFIDLKIGRDCPFAVNEYLNNNFTCMQVSAEFNLERASFFDQGFALMTPECDATDGGRELDGYHCFRLIPTSEVNFYRAADSLGIVAALLPPFIFASYIFAKMLLGIAKVLTICVEDEKTKGTVTKVFLVLQFLILIVVLVFSMLGLIADYRISFEALWVTIMIYSLGSFQAFILLLDYEAENSLYENSLVAEEEEA